MMTEDALMRREATLLHELAQVRCQLAAIAAGHRRATHSRTADRLRLAERLAAGAR